MTGAYIRIQRNGTVVPVEIEYLTDEELQREMQGRSPDELIRWIVLLSTTLREVVVSA